MSVVPEFPETPALLQSLGTALGLGLLVGLEREWTKNPIAGIRTFGLIGLFAANFRWQLGLADIAPMVFVAGAAAAGMRFAYLERQGA